MARRDYQINGATMVKVKFGEHILLNSQTSGMTDTLFELGLTSDAIRISPKFHHYDVKTDDFGPNVPAEILWFLADVHIKMTLIHWDRTALAFCISESMGGCVASGSIDNFATDLNSDLFTGTLTPAGTPLGGYVPPLSSGCHFISLNLIGGNNDQNFPAGHPAAGSLVGLPPWRFPTCYLTEQPFEMPLGTNASAVILNWRAIPYKIPPLVKISEELSFLNHPGTFLIDGIVYSIDGGEISSSGATLWERGSE